MEHLWTPKDNRKFINPKIFIYIIHVMSCFQETSGLFSILYVCWETNPKKLCQFSNALCHFLVFIMKILKAETFCFLSSADIIISVMIPIIHFIKGNGRLAQWDGKSTCISKLLTTAFSFPLQECVLNWCRWRPDCATYCPASRWRHAKTHLCL